jgi:hypothetical protein
MRDAALRPAERERPVEARVGGPQTRRTGRLQTFRTIFCRPRLVLFSCVCCCYSTYPTTHNFFCCASIVQEGDTSLLQSLQVYAFQRDLIYKLAADCARGVPGSAIFLSHASAPAPQESDCDESVPPPPSPTGPTVFYVKVPTLAVVLSRTCRTRHFKRTPI